MPTYADFVERTESISRWKFGLPDGRSGYLRLRVTTKGRTETPIEKIASASATVTPSTVGAEAIPPPSREARRIVGAAERGRVLHHSGRGRLSRSRPRAWRAYPRAFSIAATRRSSPLTVRFSRSTSWNRMSSSSLRDRMLPSMRATASARAWRKTRPRASPLASR